MMPFFTENNRLFIVMEYCDGGDLMKRIIFAHVVGIFIRM